MPAPRNVLPFQYLVRANSLQYLHGHEHAQAIETRDAELEDYLGQLAYPFRRRGKATPYG